MERPERDEAARGDGAFAGELVQRRKAAMLPSLLAAVRWRRRRRLGTRVAVVVVTAVMVGFGLDAAFAGAGHDGRELRATPIVEALPRVHCEVVGDLPDVLARCAVAPAAPADWWIDDAELQRLLDEDARPSGLVRIADRVEVTAAAIDPLATLE